MRWLLFFVFIVPVLDCRAQGSTAGMPLYAEAMSYYEYQPVCNDTAFGNDTIEIVHFRQHKKKMTETSKEIKIYRDHKLIRSRRYAKDTWSDFYYSYDAQGRLAKREKRSASGELEARVYISFAGDTVRTISSNAITTDMFESIADAEGNLLEERHFRGGECIGWQKYEWATEDYLHQLFIFGCDRKTGKTTDTIEYIFSNDSARISTCMFFQSGKVYRTDYALFDSLNHYTQIERKTEAGYRDNEKAVTITETYRYYGACPEFLEKSEMKTTYSDSKKIEHSWTIRRKGRWPENPVRQR